MQHSFLIHSSADGHLGCFHILAIINSAAMNFGVHVSLSDLVSSVCIPRRWECKVVWPLWRTVWRFLKKKLEIELPHDPAIPLLSKIFNLAVKIVIFPPYCWVNVYKVLGRTSFSKHSEGVIYYFQIVCFHFLHFHFS